MTTRRAFIQAAAGAALPVAISAGAQGIPAGTESFRRRELGAIVIDQDHEAARTFGERFGVQGSTVLSIREGDVTGAWLSAIRPLWSNHRAAIAGLTTPAALFCLEQLAWPQGLRVVFHAEHILLPDGRIEHQVQRDPRMTRLTASNLRRAGSQWPRRLSDAMAAHGAPAGPRPGPSLAALQPSLPEDATLLTSWIIAPA